MNLTLWILLFVVADAIAVYVVVKRAIAKNGGALLAGKLDLGKLARFSKEMHEEIGRYLTANYSGDPARLPQAMSGLMAMARSRAESQGLVLDDSVLRTLLETSAVRHRVAKAGEIRAALERAA